MKISYGIICTRFNRQHQFLIARRHATYAFLDFIAGAPNPQKLLNKMTADEKVLISYGDFDLLYYKAYGILPDQLDVEQKKKFNIYKKKFERRAGLNEMIKISTNANDSWDFIKGRPKCHEKPLICALREFEEETGYTLDHFDLDISETLTITFTDGHTYQYILYFAQMTKIIPLKYNPNQEILELRWVSAEDARTLLRNEFKEAIPKIIKYSKNNKNLEENNAI